MQTLSVICIYNRDNSRSYILWLEYWKILAAFKLFNTHNVTEKKKDEFSPLFIEFSNSIYLLLENVEKDANGTDKGIKINCPQVGQFRRK